MVSEAVTLHLAEASDEAARASVQALLLALARSRLDAARQAAHKRGVRLDDVRVEAAADFDERGEPEGVRLSVRVESRASDAEVAKVFELAERACVVSKLLLFEPDVVLVHEHP